MTPTVKEAGHRIRKIREIKDLNQQNMADKLEITAGTYAKIEHGERDPPQQACVRDFINATLRS